MKSKSGGEPMQSVAEVKTQVGTSLEEQISQGRCHIQRCRGEPHPRRRDFSSTSTQYTALESS